MIMTARCAKFLQSLPETDAAAVLDAVQAVVADPLANPRHCKHLGPDLYEARISLPPNRAFRVMFSYRRDGLPVLLSGCLKKSTADHQREINHARAVLSADDIPQGVAMPYSTRSPRKDALGGHPVASDAPFDFKTPWLYDEHGNQWRIVHATRKKIIVQTGAGRVTLSRARLERDGIDHVNGATFRVCHPSYALPMEQNV